MSTDYTPGSAKEILQENGVEMVKIDNVWYLEKIWQTHRSPQSTKVLLSTANDGIRN